MAKHREVLTFQLGNYTNYVSAHWWNIQESYFSYDEKNPSEICHDVLFREGLTFKGTPTFTPRTVVVDKRENARHISVLNENCCTSKSTAVVWDPGRMSTEYMTVPERHDYIQDLEKIEKGQKISKKHYNFDETVRTWTDYFRTRYHPRSLSLINNELETEIFHSGNEIYNSIEENVVEKVRAYLEECNNLQGFQLLADATDAYGGLSHQIVLHLSDEYPNKTVFTFPIIPSYYNTARHLDDIYKMINLLLCYQKLTEFCDLVIPISTIRTAWRGLGPAITFPNLVFDSKNYYQTSAILAAYLDSVSLKYRLKSDFSSLSEIASGLNFWNRNICAASMSLPFPIAAHSYLLDFLENYDESIPLWNCLTPSCTIGNERIFYQKITIRGITSDRLKDPSVKRRDSQAYACSTVTELLHLYLKYHLNTISDVISARTPLKTATPFPKIFSRRISRIGSIIENSQGNDIEEVLSCPTLAGLHSCKDIGRMLESLYLSVRGINIKKFHQFLGVGMDLDEYKECLEKILLLGNEYVGGMEM